MAHPNSSSSPSIRVLVRTPPPTASSTSPASSSTSVGPVPTAAPAAASISVSNPSSSPLRPPSPSPSPSNPEGVVVVGFLGSRPSTDATHLINRILDANVFGCGNLDKDLFASRSESSGKVEEWFRRRRISFHFEKEKGVVFLQLSSSLSPFSLLCSSRTDDEGYRSVSALETCDADDLRGMLFMFSVCHVIIFLQDGARFDTQILKRFRMLQNAKHALAPFVRSKIAPTLSKTTSAILLPNAARVTSISPPSRRSGASNRHGSSISLMSGSGSNSSVLPGQCTPVILFVFVDDLFDGSNPSPSAEDSGDAMSLTQLTSVGGPSKPGLSVKGSGPVVVLTHPASKNEGSFKKKLQSSLESQVRFLIKKCRTLVGTEHSNLGPRGAGSLSNLPLFLLDASRIVSLVDRSMIQRGESLDFMTGLIEDALNSKRAIDVFSLENHCQNLNNEDIQSIKDFLYRQVDALRGRGGLPGSASSGSVVGVGMVAAAAAAAAASAAAGKPVSAPELPSLERWLSLSILILDSLLSVEDSFLDEDGKVKRSFLEKHANEMQDQQISLEDAKSIEAAISCLESSKDLNLKFSISWCQRALPAAKKVYLNELPPFYPTSLHKAHLERALHFFNSMVKGPAMQKFSRKLEEECTTIWESGRQLCDAVSLTGKPCMHQIHDDKKQHSSGYVFLHACACGRSRKFRDDPFDFESANITFSCFANCEDLLPTLILPRGSHVRPLSENSWRLMRIAGARYYKPSKGLLQTGFSSTEKYLLKWTISLEKQKGANCLLFNTVGKSSFANSTPECKLSPVLDDDVKKTGAGQLQRETKSGASENFRKKSEAVPLEDSSISFGKGLPSFPMKKPFSEVVASNNSVDPFPSLQQKKLPKENTEKIVRKFGVPHQNGHRVSVAVNYEGPQKAEHMFSHESMTRSGTKGQTEGNPVLQIGSNIVPVNIGGEKIPKDNHSKQVIVYVGFEHECSFGHRFLISPEHLKELESSYSLADKLHSSADDSGQNSDTKTGLYEKVPENLSGTTTTVNNMKKTQKSMETSAKYNEQQGRITLLSRYGAEWFEPVNGLPLPAGYEQKLDRNILHVRLDDGGSAFSLLNRKLPLHMNCPYCRNLTRKDQKIKFAGTTSQLQRIFLVTPPLPTVLATCPVIQFEDSCLPPSIQNREQQSQFSLDCQVILPPESFLTFKLPFVYGVQMDDGSLHPLNHLEHQPELTAWLVEGTALQVVSTGHEYYEEASMGKNQG
ncbi:uncharacterized protein LOC135636639 [Musa acuminata AAA Group]|uniref:uncharacterized protein LOC135636639 n=1 Tax=Musa acuminata AAA Group TaxID=214697 RepID=UPI0031D9F5EA